jgi:tRNA uridine 5-carboxymethylaminomethyl modification enzyme
MLRSLDGFANAEIMRYAYAIEYDCVDPTQLYPTLEFKNISCLYGAGQFNGTSGYEEAAAQGLVAGINAALKLKGEDPMILERSGSYIGTLIDDLTTKGTNEPYRMMTSRAEYRIILRQDNSDFRLTEIGRNAGLVTDERYENYLNRKREYEKATLIMQERLKPKEVENILTRHGLPYPNTSVSRADLIRRGIEIEEIVSEFNGFENISKEIIDTVSLDAKYEGYLQRSLDQIAKAKRLEEKLLPKDINYLEIEGLRLEARQKLDKIRPLSLGRAERISGVSPADIAVLMVYLKK